jgi:integrase
MARKTALVRQVPTPIVPARERRPATRSQRVSHRGLFLTREEMAAIATAAATERDQLLVRATAETGARHGAATAMLEDSDDDPVFVRDQLGHRNIRETLRYAALSEAKRREKAAKLRIAPETWS